MSQVHQIIVFLVLFLVGVAILFVRLFPTLVASYRRRTLPYILARLATLALTWIAAFFILLLLAHYRLFMPPPYYSTILAATAAAIPWLTLWWVWRWSEQLDREARKDN